MIGAAGLIIACILAAVEKRKRRSQELSRYLVGVFNERLTRQENQLEVLRQDASENAMEVRKLLRREEFRGARLEELERSVILSLEATKKVLHHTLTHEERLRGVEVGLKQVEEGRVGDYVEELRKEVKDLAGKFEDYVSRPPEGAPGVEVKQQLALVGEEGILSRLTPTERMVLKILAEEDAKTSRQIEKVLGKTREHTARLMKKLYAEGYVERDSHKLPYVYRINDRVRRALERAKPLQS